MENSRNAAPRRGMAIFAVLSLMVVFTVLGVAAITIAQRDNSASGSVFDIKQREAAAYAGLVYAQNELARDPANLLAILESWRQAPSSPSLYLKFDPATKVTLSKTKPTPFQIPGTTSNITVEIAGISLPTTSTEEPNLALRSTGSGSSGDEQTLLGVYEIKNIRVSTGSSSLPITHPLFISGNGIWDAPVSISGGDAYFGTTHSNSTSTKLKVTNAGLRVAGNLSIDNFDTFNVEKPIYINGDLSVDVVKSAYFRENVVVKGNINFTSSGRQLRFGKSLYVLGKTGITTLKGNRIIVGADDPTSQFYIPNGNLCMDNGWITVNGSAFLHQIDCSKSFTLDVIRRLELTDSTTVRHKFSGKGAWGQLVVRRVESLSSLLEDPITIPAIFGARNAAFGNGILINGNGTPGDSWVESANLTIGSSTSRARLSAGSNLEAMAVGSLYFDRTIPLTASRPAGVSLRGGPDGFETGSGTESPVAISALGVGLPPNEVNDREPDVDMLTDPTAINKAWTAVASSACNTSSKICARAIQNAYDADSSAKSHFHNGFFVVRLAGPLWDWDAGGDSAVPLRGKFFFYVDANYGSAQIWPTTASNPDPKNPKNVIFIYARGNNLIFDGFSPRYKNNTTTPVVFTGYVRYDGTKSCAAGGTNPPNKFEAPLIMRGAFHVVGPYNGTPGSSQCTGLTINSGKPITFEFDQAALNAIGAAFGTNFIVDGKSLGPPPGQFLLMENWIQFRTLGELR